MDPLRENSLLLKCSKWHVLTRDHTVSPTSLFTKERAILPLLPSCSASPYFGRYSFPFPQRGRRLSWPGWLVTYRDGVPA